MATLSESDEVALQLLEDITKNAKTIQENMLAQILAQNAHTEYLMAFDLHLATHKSQAFKSKVPIVGYDDLQPLIQRIADGDTSPILSAHPISEFLLSSGTSGGEQKLIPATKQSRSIYTLMFYNLARAILNIEVKGLEGGKGLHFMFTKKERVTKGGIPLRPASTSTYKTERFKNHITNVLTSPVEAIYCTDAYQSMYAQMLCGLYERDQVRQVGSNYASGLLRAIRFLQRNWQPLTHDIRTGTLNLKLTDASLCQRMTLVVRPDPILADFIAHECGKSTWEGIIARIWPNTKFLRTVITGTMSQYIKSLDYYSGGLHILSPTYACSEAYVGINLNPMCNPSQISYTIMPNMAYFEFLPYDSNSIELNTNQQLVDLVNVEIDKEYELVVTTYAGLNRYRVGDILRVSGFYNSVPQFQFVCRKNVILTIDVENTQEVDLHKSVEKASRLLDECNVTVVDYTSYADESSIPGHYVIYYELSVNEVDNSLMQRCCLEMEESLNVLYRRFRGLDMIGPLEIRIVKNGTFEELMEFAISRGASIVQYKMPRCIKDQQIIHLLNSRLVSTHFSPSLPQE